MSLFSLRNRRFEVPEIDVRGNEATIYAPSKAAQNSHEGEYVTPRVPNDTEPRIVRIPETTWG